MPPADFPDDHALCEHCGYPLRALAREADCPECGQPIAESDPIHRPGSGIPGRPLKAEYLYTVLMLTRKPKVFFRRMSLGGSNAKPRLVLLVNAVLATTIWLAMGVATATLDTGIDNFVFYWMGGMLIFNFVLVLTYIEVLGVTLFSRRRGWRVPMRLAERVACYASMGWVPGAFIAAGAWQIGPRAVSRLWQNLGGNPDLASEAGFAVATVLTVLALILFESLVWLGVRQVKYGNRPPVRGKSSIAGAKTVYRPYPH